jgi:SAM-dependent methyltransferase
MDFITEAAAGTEGAARVLDVGGRDINGSPRHLWPAADYEVVDPTEGPRVTHVGTIETFKSRHKFDVVVCAEVLEHAPDWPAVVKACVDHLRKGGRLILTAACPPRMRHSGYDGGVVRPGEHYENVDPDLLRSTLRRLPLKGVEVQVHEDRGDVYAAATRA